MPRSNPARPRRPPTRKLRRSSRVSAIRRSCCRTSRTRCASTRRTRSTRRAASTTTSATTAASTTARRATSSAVAGSSSTTRWRTGISAIRATWNTRATGCASCATRTGTTSCRATTGNSTGATARSARRSTARATATGRVRAARGRARDDGRHRRGPPADRGHLRARRAPFLGCGRGPLCGRCDAELDRVVVPRPEREHAHDGGAARGVRGDRPPHVPRSRGKARVPHHAAAGRAVGRGRVGALPCGLVGRLGLQQGRQLEHLPPVGLPARTPDRMGEAAADPRAAPPARLARARGRAVRRGAHARVGRRSRRPVLRLRPRLHDLRPQQVFLGAGGNLRGRRDARRAHRQRALLGLV